MSGGSFKIIVKMHRRPDGGLRVWSDELPGLVLSNRNPELVMNDIIPAMEAILSDQLGCQIKAERLTPLPSFAPISQPMPIAAKISAAVNRVNDAIDHFRGRMEYAALPCA